jgi:STAM-binding protein
MMYFRYSELVLKLPTHPEYKLAESKKLFRPLNGRARQAIGELEKINPEIQRENAEWHKMYESIKPMDAGYTTSRPRESTYEHFAARDPSLSGNAKVLDAAEHQELAVDLAQKEIRRRDAQKKATRRAGISEEEELDRRKAGVWDNTGQLDMVKAREMLLKREQWEAEPKGPRREIRPTTNFSYKYPTIQKSTPVQHEPAAVLYRREESYRQPPPPPRPSKETLLSPSLRLSQHEPYPPPVPGKEWSTYNHLLTADLTAPAELPELPSKEEPAPPKKQRLTFRPAAYLENGDPVRPVFIPSALRESFLDVAAENTRKGLEMCGILCGTLVNNAVFISCLLIPEQKCTTDTCETENESAMLDYCINEDLLVVGWIHTHPTQTCFMSSRDLHTQAAYQVMMPESIAIVCAPKFDPSYVFLIRP